MVTSSRASIPPPPGAQTGIVLSGGGARGAYQVGIIAGILEVLEGAAHAEAPFNVVAGTSVGAINASYLAAHAHVTNLEIEGLIEAWKGLRLTEYLKVNVRGLLGLWKSSEPDPVEGLPSMGPVLGRALLDSVPFARLVQTRVPFEQLHHNIDAGLVRALVITALEIGSGRTTMFIEARPEVEFAPSRDPRRLVRRDRLTMKHILASAALPLVFPPQRIDGQAYSDGGLRFNTPISPAIRAGADRLVVISLLGDPKPPPPGDVAHELLELSYKNPLFLLGKVLNALLLDPTHYDLQVLERFNKLIETMEGLLTPAQLHSFHKVVQDDRNNPYRKLRTLVFRPSSDLGELAVDYMRGVFPEGIGPRMLHRLATQRSVWQPDLVSFLCFDGGFAEHLIRLGRRDALARDKEILDFYE